MTAKLNKPKLLRCFVTRILLLVGAMFLVGASSLFADPDQPNLLLHLDGILGEELKSNVFSSDGISGGQAGVELLPSQNWGLDLDYKYLSVGKSPVTGSDNDIAGSIRVLWPSFGETTLTLLGGVAYNTTSNFIDSRLSAFVGPGMRVVVASHLAIDAGVQYRFTSPRGTFVQSLEATIGFSVPLDGSFATCNSESPATEVQAEEATEVATEVATPVATAVSTPVAISVAPPSGLVCYVVKKGDYLWKIAGDPAVFGDSRLWPLLLETNSDRIEDPDFLLPGLVLTFKRAYTTDEIAAARKKEWFTPAFQPNP
jgi:hypothetical protein